MAADYFQHTPSEGPRETDFWVNSIAQVPNLPSVMSHAVQNRLWLIILIAALEVGVFVLWRVMKKLDRELWGKG
jgi:hypothetical protein